MDMRKIKKLIELIQETGVKEIEIKEGEESVRITTCDTADKNPPAVMMMPAQMGFAPQAAALSVSVDAPKDAVKSGSVEPPPLSPDKHTIKAPMVGTVYLSATPGAKPFIDVGQTVKVGDVICLIEAMKMFNQIEADRAGKITAKLVDNGTPVEFNQPLFVIEE